MVDDFNNIVENNTVIEYSDIKAFNGKGRNFVYILDATCSVCVRNYCLFLKAMKSEELTLSYDSVYTIYMGDMLLLNYTLKTNDFSKLPNERYIEDVEGELSEYYYELSGNNNVLFFVDNRLMYSASMYNYVYVKDVGIVPVEIVNNEN